MTIPVTTRAVKGSPLSTVEMDTNLTDLGRDATEVQQGNVQFATEAETEAQAIDDRAISPLNLPFGIEAYTGSLAKSLTTPEGYATLPGGLIVQWGQISADASSTTVTTAGTFPLVFPNSVLTVIAANGDDPGSFNTSSRTSSDVASWSVTGFNLQTYSAATRLNRQYIWIALGF